MTLPRGSGHGAPLGGVLHDDPGLPHHGEAWDTNVDASSWIWDGILAGAMSAATIALFFLLLDVARGRPLWTPYALGSAIFMGRSVAANAFPVPAIVAAYTVLHGTVFLIAGLAASFTLLGHRKHLGFAAGGLVALALFAGFEAFFLVFFTTFAGSVSSGLFAELGTGRIAVANLLAALVMAGLSLRPPLER